MKNASFDGSYREGGWGGWGGLTSDQHHLKSASCEGSTRLRPISSAAPLAVVAKGYKAVQKEKAPPQV